MIGQTLGNYRITEQIGMGGMATVYKAYDPDMDRYVAIKVLPGQFSQDPTFKERFQREARAIAKLEHLHILPIFGYGEDNNITYMVMRYLQAGTLTDRIGQGSMPFSEISGILAQISDALDYAHAHNILHRDVKPSNVLLDAQGNAYLTDFGIAKMVESNVDLTGTGLLGTPAYMSPEQCRGSKELTPATDQYSLGIVLYEMITGRAPFQAETPIALIHMQLNEPLPMPHTLRPDLLETAEQVILKSLAKEPESRYPTCNDMAAAFARAVNRQAIATPSPQTETALPPHTISETTDEPTLLHHPESPAPPIQGRPRWLWGAGALLLVLIGSAAALGLGFLLFGQEKAQTAESLERDEAEPVEASQIEMTESVVDESGEIPPEMMLQFWGARTIYPCDWDGIGDGLCIRPQFSEEGPIRILEDADLIFIDSPGFSPDGRHIVFSAAEKGVPDEYASARIYTAAIDGSNLVELPSPDSNIAPAWSPNGEWLAFVHNGDLAIIHPDGSDFEIILQPNDTGSEVCGLARPQWSPDSERIVVSAEETDNCEWEFPMTREVWVISNNGDNIEPVVTTIHPSDECTDFATAFSPNGDQIAYIDEECQPNLINADGSGKPTPINNHDFPWGWRSNVFPQWYQLLYVERCEWLDIGGPGLCITFTDSNDVVRILDDAGLDLDRFYGHTWSPDGEWLAFSAAEPDVELNSLYLFNLENGDLEEVPLPENVSAPAWRSDGEWLALHFAGQLAIVRPDGSDLTLLHESEACIENPQWSPDGEWLIVSAQLEPPGCEYEFPQTRQVLAVSAHSGETVPIAQFTLADECDGANQVAFGPNGEHIAFTNQHCESLLTKFANPNEIIQLEQFPWWWTSQVSPQWARVRPN